MTTRVAPPKRPPRVRVAQAWIELLAPDPAAVSALAVMRARLDAGGEVVTLKRMRLMELRGPLPTRPRLERLLDASSQFFNPHKERCILRNSGREPAPVPAGARVVVVTEREGDRRPAAERWWLHETGRDIEVREGVAWILEFSPGAGRSTADLVVLRDRRHGLLCNPLSEDHRIGSGRLPLPWLAPIELDSATPSVAVAGGEGSS